MALTQTLLSKVVGNWRVQIVVSLSSWLIAECRLWSTKQEQEKVLDEDATKRKQESADAKVCPFLMHNAAPSQCMPAYYSACRRAAVHKS